MSHKLAAFILSLMQCELEVVNLAAIDDDTSNVPSFAIYFPSAADCYHCYRSLAQERKVDSNNIELGEGEKRLTVEICFVRGDSNIRTLTCETTWISTTESFPTLQPKSKERDLIQFHGSVHTINDSITLSQFLVC